MDFIDLLLRGFEICSRKTEYDYIIAFRFQKEDFKYQVEISQDALLSFTLNRQWLNVWEERVTNDVIEKFELYTLQGRI